MLFRSLPVTLLMFVFVEKNEWDRGQADVVCVGKEKFEKKTHSCTECPRGYYGINCTKPCPAGNYGIGCQTHCPQACRNTCDATTGECSQLPKRTCPPEYDGINCTMQCPAGNYGPGCKSICPRACRNTCDATTGECLQVQSGSEPTIIETTSQSHAGPQSQRKYFSNSIIVIILGSVFVFILITVLIYYVQKILRHTLLRKNQGQLRISLSLREDTIYQQINENILPT